MKELPLFLTLAIALASSAAQAEATDPPQPVEARITTEEGFLAVFHNRFQFGAGGTESNLVTEGGEDILSPTRRYAAALDDGRHRLHLLYHPVDLRTRETLRRDLIIDDTTFAAGSSVAFR